MSKNHVSTIVLVKLVAILDHLENCFFCYLLNCFTYILGSRQQQYSDTYFLNLINNQWSRGPDLSTAKIYHTCNLVMTDQRQIVVIGGYVGYGKDGALDIIDVDKKTKRQGIRY